MGRTILHVAVTALAVLVVTQLSDAVRVRDLNTALMTAAGIGLVNAVLRPLVLLLAFPLTWLTLGAFRLVVNGGLLYLVAAFIDGFVLDGFLAAIWVAAAISLVRFLLDAIIRVK